MVKGREERDFNGGMNKDADVRFLKAGEYIDALNVRVFSTDNGSDGIIENVKGNSVQRTKSDSSTYTLPSGINRCIGSTSNDINDSVFAFIWNSEGHHVILKYSQSSNTIAEVIKDNTYTSSTFSGIATYSVGDVVESSAGSGEYYECFIGVNLSTYGGSSRIDNRYLFEKIGNYLDFRQFNLIQSRVLNKDGEELLFWTDDVDEEGNERVRYINTDRALAGNYPTNNRKEYFDVAASAPLFRPRVTAGNASTVLANKISDKYYQFKYRYIHLDGQPSSWSPYSEIPRYLYNSLSTAYNSNKITVQIGKETVSSDTIDKIEIAVRECGDGNSGDWYRIKTIETATATLTSYTTANWGIDRGADTYAHYYTFDWDGSGDSFAYSVDEQAYDYSFVPQAAKAIEFINDNRLSLHNTTMGYDISNITPDISMSYNFSGGSPSAIENAFQKTFKKGASYEYGVRYSDGKGRVTTVLVGDGSDFGSDYNSGAATYNQTIHPRMELGHEPPSWAVTWQMVVRPAVNLAYEGSTPDFQQFPIGNLATLAALNTTYGVGGYYLYSIGSIATWDYDHRNNRNVAADLSVGNRYRQYMTTAAGNGTDPSTYVDIQGSGSYTISGETYLMTIGTQVWSQGDIGEIYRPAGQSSSLWYEMGEAFRVGIDTNGAYAHFALSDLESYNRDQVTGTTTSRQELLDADCYLGVFEFFDSGTYPAGGATGRTATTDPTAPVSTGWMETAWIDYANPSKSNDRGRVNTLSNSFGRYTTKGRSVFSQPIVQESERANFSIIYSGDFVDNNNQFGAVQTVYQLNQNLYIFQENRVGYRPVARQIIEDLNAQQLIGTSGEIFGDVVYLPQEYGIGKQPESLAVYGSDMFFTDISNAAVLRLKGGQLQPISDLGIKSLMDDLASYVSIFNYPFIHGEYDAEFDEYIMSIDFKLISNGSDWSSQSKGVGIFEFDAGDDFLKKWVKLSALNPLFTQSATAYFRSTDTNLFTVQEGVPAEINSNPSVESIDTTYIDVTDDNNYAAGELRGTIAFSNKAGKWSTRYSYEPESMVAANSKLITFKEGYPYLHSDNDFYNRFYGTDYDTKITVPFNQNPSQKKNYTTLTLDSTDAMGVSMSNNIGQESSLLEEDFILREGKYSSEILRDSTTPNLTYPLLDGDKLIDTNLTAEFSISKATLFSMFNIIARYVNSRI